MGGGGAGIKFGKGLSKKRAPTSTALELDEGYIIMPAPLNVLGAQAAIAIYKELQLTSDIYASKEG